jgi:hypothetical protein
MGAFNIRSALQTINDTVPGRKFGDKKPVPKPRLRADKEGGAAASGDKIGEDTITDPVMELVTRTLKDMVHVIVLTYPIAHIILLVQFTGIFG